MTNTSIGGKRKAVSEAAEDGKRSRLDNAEDENTPPGGEDFLLSPVRRKGPQLWSPKLRWKDERKRVLKISMNKLRTIDDPEMFLRRSVLINNTMKKLQKEIREEKTLRHLQDPFGPSDAAFGVPLVAKDASFGASDVNSSDNSWTVHQNSPNPSECRFAARRGCQPSGEVGASCDEIFGVNEDYLRINLPERLPPAMVVETAEKSSSTSGLATTAPSASTELTPSNRPGSSVNCGSTVSSTSSSYVSTAPSISCPCTSSTCSCSTRIKTNPRFYDPPVSRCCSTQYRNGPDPLYFGDAGSYCPHAAPPSCVDSVIYHSLMASLES